MFWLTEVLDNIEERFADRIKKGEEIVVREEKTSSGRVHVGSLRAASLHGIIAEGLKERGVKAKFSFEINDFDPMDGCPPNLQPEFLQYMGQPLCNVPSPDGKMANFAEYFAKEYSQVILDLGFEPEFYRASELYKTGQMNEVIQKTLENADQIRALYQKISKSKKPDDWYPFQVICPKCGKVGTTRVYDFDGKLVSFKCEPKMVSWAEGCSYEGQMSPFDGNGKLPWKVEWPAKWKVVQVDVEWAGKDHYTKGGSRDIGRAICEQIFDYSEPYGQGHEFILVGGAKMSSSKGSGASAREVADLLPREIARLLLLRKNPKKIINFDPQGDTVPTLFDEYDRLIEQYFAKQEEAQEVCKILYPPKERQQLKPLFQPRFRDLSFMIQIPHIDLQEKLAEIKGEKINKDEQKALERRISYIQKWLDNYAPEKYIFKIAEKLPVSKESLSETDIQVCKEILQFFQENEQISGNDLHGFFHSLKEKLNISPREVFSPIYRIFLGREDGPKAGFLLSVLDADFVQKRLTEAL